MFTDIVGYTKMAQAKESLALELLEEHRALVRPLFPVHGGAEVKTIGDAFLVEFKSALEAVLCAVEIQKTVEERNSRASPDHRVRVRVGVHLGDVVHQGGDVYGDAVNIASRIEPLAEPGGVCISQQVYDSIRNKTELGITRMGDIELKNVELPMPIYRIEMAPMGDTASPLAPRERLAVLPFVNISPDPNDEYFADGLTEELITKLSEVKGLKVIARTSVMNYKKKEKNISQIGRELDVGSVIEGSVRKAGSKIRVTVQLVDSRTEEHLWASNYDSQLDDIFAIQSDVAAKVASSVSKGLLPASHRNDTADVEAYALYLKGTQRFHEDVEPALRESVKLFEGAIARDPTFARAHAALALAYVRLAAGGYEDYAVTELRAEPAARMALQLDPNSAEAHATMGAICSLLDRFDQAVTESERAVALNPNLAEAHLNRGINEASMLRLQEGIASMEKAHELDPLSQHTADLLARTARVAGLNSRSREVLQKMDLISPNNPKVICGLAETCMFDRDFAGAQELLARGLKINPEEPLLRLNQGLLYALVGRTKDAEQSLREFEQVRLATVRLYGRLFLNAVLGNLDQAFDALNQAAELHSWPFLIGSLPVFEQLRKDPRYKQFAERVGIPLK